MRPRIPAPWAEWLCFSLFLVLNALLALGPFSLVSKLWIGAAGLPALILLSFFSKSHGGGAGMPENPPQPPLNFPVWTGLLFIGTGLFLRFCKLTSLSTWPNPDESLAAVIALHISQMGDWHFFYTTAQNTFVYFWALAAWIKPLGLSLTTLWLFPAALSSLTLPLLYLTARQWGSRGFSLLLTAMGSLAYWAVYAGRNGFPTILVPPAELLSLFFLGRLLSGRSTSRPRRDTACLALALAGGFYVYSPAWPPFVILVLVALAASWKAPGSQARFSASLGSVVFSAALLPFVVSAFREHYGSYFRGLQWSASSLEFQQLLVSASYLTGLFWGKKDGDYYGPFWGGLFDPLTAALFFMGALYAWRNRASPTGKWALAAVVLTLLPGIFSSNLEFFRVFLVLPFVLFLAAEGFQGLAFILNPRQRPWFLGGILAIMGALNAYHLLGPYQRHWENPGPSWGYYKSPENARAYQILEQAAGAWGPGYLFQNFPCDMSDASLTVASYPFNLAVNPQIRFPHPRWFAVLANDNYRPFLMRRFPCGRWFQLSGDLDRPDGGLGLGLFPLASIPGPTLEAWSKANNAFQEVAYAFLNRPTGTDYSKPLEALDQFHVLMQGDPFLESCYWEKTYYLYFQNGAFGDRQKWADFESAFQALRQALGHGYPAAHLLNEYGSCLMLMRLYPEAEKAFEEAIQANPSFSPASDNLSLLRRRLSGNPAPSP